MSKRKRREREAQLAQDRVEQAWEKQLHREEQDYFDRQQEAQRTMDEYEAEGETKNED